MSKWMITIKEPYINRIVDGTKLYEIRTKVPKSLVTGDKIFVVQSGSDGKIVISFDVAGIYRYTPAYIWAAFRIYLGIELIDFQKYTLGRRGIYLIKIRNIKKFDNCPNVCNIGLKRAPQWFSRITDCQSNFLEEFHYLKF